MKRGLRRPLIDELLEEIPRAYADADPAPWRWVSAFDGSVRVEGGDGFNVLEHEQPSDKDVANAYLIALLHRLVPLLTAEIDDLRAELNQIKGEAIADRYTIDRLERRAAGQP